jgi:hypothetical protein
MYVFLYHLTFLNDLSLFNSQLNAKKFLIIFNQYSKIVLTFNYLQKMYLFEDQLIPSI